MATARKIAPPAGLSDADRKLYAAAPAPRVKDDRCEKWVFEQSPAHLRGAFLQGKIPFTVLEQRLIDSRLHKGASKALSEADASLEGNVYLRGGVRPNAKKSSTPTRYRMTPEQGRMRDQGRYVTRTIETTRRFRPLTEAEEGLFARIECDRIPGNAATKIPSAPQCEQAFALGRLAEALEAETDRLRRKNNARMKALGLEVDAA